MPRIRIRKRPDGTAALIGIPGLFLMDILVAASLHRHAERPKEEDYKPEWKQWAKQLRYYIDAGLEATKGPHRPDTRPLKTRLREKKADREFVERYLGRI